MTPGMLLSVLETVADDCRTVELPDDPFDQDALYKAAMNASGETLLFAKRVAEARWVGRRRRRST